MAMFANHYKLDNLIVIIDSNKMQALGEVFDTADLKEKWSAFGWHVCSVNGHNPN
jgi:transketolase